MGYSRKQGTQIATSRKKRGIGTGDPKSGTPTFWDDEVRPLLMLCFCKEFLFLVERLPSCPGIEGFGREKKNLLFFSLFLACYRKISTSRRGAATTTQTDIRCNIFAALRVCCRASLCRSGKGTQMLHLVPRDEGRSCRLSGPLNQLNAILSLLQAFDCYRAPSAKVSAIGRPYLALSHIHAQIGVLNRLVLNRLGCSTAR